MYFAKMEPMPGAVSGGVGLYHDHKMLWKLFAHEPDAERDFLFRRDLIGGRPRYFLVGGRQLQTADHPRWRIQQKPYQPDLGAGDRLFFQLRANPVVSRNRKRFDIIMDAKKRIGPDWALSEPDLIQQTGLQWLHRRARSRGFEFNDDRVRVEGYLQHRLRKPGSERPIQISTLDFEGLLRVTEPGLFVRALFQGIGHAKAFGCGLMLVRRA